MKKQLQLSNELSLPLSVVTEKLSWLGRTGQGKTYGAMRLAELMLDAGAQIVVLDPVDVWKFLRIPAKGGRAFPIYVFGGSDGDFPLNPDSGELIAELIVTRRISAVLNVSQFEYEADLNRFATAFGRKFFHLKKTHRSPVHLFLEECEDFIPQYPEKDEIKKLSVFARHILKQGRNFGIGASMISQRPQDIHKKALGLTEIMFSFQFTSPNEREAIGKWVNEKGIVDDIGKILPHLEKGTPHVWSPSLLKISKAVHISKRESLDGSSTPDFDSELQVGKLSPVDIESLKTAMSEVVEEAKADDPKELRTEIARLRREIQFERGKTAPAKTVEKHILGDDQIKRLENVFAQFSLVEKSTRELAKSIIGLNDDAVAEIGKTRLAIQSFNRPAISKTPVRVFNTPNKVQPETDGEISKYERELLQVLARRNPIPTSKGQLALLASKGTKSSQLSISVKRFLREGMVSGSEHSMLLTEIGFSKLGTNIPLPPQSKEEEIAMWREGMTDYERAVYDSLVEMGEATEEELSTRSGKSLGSSQFKQTLSMFTRNKLAVRNGTQISIQQ